jgi:hypothetical protein
MVNPTVQYGPYAHGDDIKTSIRGRRTGLDMNDALVGHSGIREQYEIWNAGSTATTTNSTAQIAASGISYMETSTASTFYMPAAAAKYVGGYKTLSFASTGGGNIEVDLISGYFRTSASSTWIKMTFVPVSGALFGSADFQCLQSASTAYYWALIGSTGGTGSGSTHIVFS